MTAYDNSGASHAYSSYFTAYIFYIRHPCYGQLTSVKTGYHMTISIYLPIDIWTALDCPHWLVKLSGESCWSGDFFILLLEVLKLLHNCDFHFHWELQVTRWLDSSDGGASAVQLHSYLCSYDAQARTTRGNFCLRWRCDFLKKLWHRQCAVKITCVATLAQLQEIEWVEFFAIKLQTLSIM